MTKRYVMTPARKRALRKAQLASARKRGGKRRGKRGLSKSGVLKTGVVAGGVFVGAYATYNKINPNITLYHGTSAVNADSIIKEQRLRGMSATRAANISQPEKAGLVFFSQKQLKKIYGASSVSIKIRKNRLNKIGKRDNALKWAGAYSFREKDLYGIKIKRAR